MQVEIIHPDSPGRVFVSKRWGWEDWILNDKDANLCQKVLFVKARKFIGIHRHPVKDEVITCHSGSVIVTYLQHDDALRWLQGPAAGYDVVFLDPPFGGGLLQPVIDLLEQRGWLLPGALVYLERDANEPPPHLPGNWRIRRSKRAGQAAYQLLEHAT